MVDSDKRRTRGSSAPRDSSQHSQHSGKTDRNSAHARYPHPRERIGSANRDRNSPTLSDRGDRRKDDIYGSRSPSAGRHNIRVERGGNPPSVLDDTNANQMESLRTGQYIHNKTQHLDPSTAASGRNSRNNRNRKMENMIRNDSLSSDPSDCSRPPPPKPHKHRRGIGKKQTRQHSLSSSDDEIRSTPECSSCEEQANESESLISEKGKGFRTFRWCLLDSR